MFDLKTEKFKKLFTGLTGKGMESKNIIPNVKELEENIEEHEMNAAMDGENGIYYGVNLNTNKKIYYNKNNLNYGHEFILGVPGSGKSNLVKSELKEIYENTNDVIIVIQDESESFVNSSYSSLAELYNETHIQVSNCKINPFELYSYDEILDKDSFRNVLDPKIEFIMNFIFSVTEGKLTPKHNSLIASVINEMYSYSNSNEYTPTMSDLIKLIKKNDLKELDFIVDILEKKFNKGLSNFDCKNKKNFNSKERFIIYNMSDINYDIYNETIIILLENIRNMVIQNDKKQVRTHIVIDSIDGIVNDIVGQYLKILLKRLRINYGMVTLVGSNTDLIINNQYYNAILYNLCNIGTIRLLNQNYKSIEDLSEILKISKSGKWYINNSERGTGLLISDNLEIPFKFKKK